MSETQSSSQTCKKCGAALQIRSVNYLGKTGLILLSILAWAIASGFFYIVITTSQGGNFGKLLVFGAVVIFSLAYKVSKIHHQVYGCLRCDPLDKN